MVAALRARGIPVAYVPFAGERHGFRTAAAITRALTGELYFYSRIFSFTPADPITPIPIHNLPQPLDDHGRDVAADEPTATSRP
jgi:hypothetical protein